MESRFRFIVVGCLQRLGSAAACVRCHSLMSLATAARAARRPIFCCFTRLGVCYMIPLGS